MNNNKLIMLSVALMSLLIGVNGMAAKKEHKGPQVEEFPSQPSIENLYVKVIGPKTKKVNDLCIGAFDTGFIQQAVVQIRARETFGTGKIRAAAGRRLLNVEKETRQAVTDEAYAYARKSLADAGFNLKSDKECMALKDWDKLKVNDDVNGELKEGGALMGIVSGGTHSSRHVPTGRPAYKAFGTSVLGDMTNNAVKGMKLASKQKIGVVDFSFLMDFNVSVASAEVKTSTDRGAYVNTVTTSKNWSFDFTDTLFVGASTVNYMNPKYKSATWMTGPAWSKTIPANLDTSYITGFEENSTVWDKRINAVNFDLTIDQAKYKEIYLESIKAYIDVYVAEMSALKPM